MPSKSESKIPVRRLSELLVLDVVWRLGHADALRVADAVRKVTQVTPTPFFVRGRISELLWSYRRASKLSSTGTGSREIFQLTPAGKKTVLFYEPVITRAYPAVRTLQAIANEQQRTAAAHE